MSIQCSYKKQDGNQCKMKTARQYPTCWIHLKKEDGLQVKDSKIPNAGKGLFYVGKQAIPPKTKIAKYSSREILRKNPETDYTLQFSRNQYMDSSDKLNHVGRYINDSKKANVRFGNSYRAQKEVINNHTRYTIPIITTKRIQPNTELLISYGNKYW